MTTLPPSHYSSDLTDDRLQVIAERLLDVRYDVADILSSQLDDNYTRETTTYGRQRNMIIQLALSNQFDWLGLRHTGMDITFSIGIIPCRFFTDDPLHPHKDGFFKRNATDDLFATDDQTPIAWRFIVAKAQLETEEEKVYFIGYNAFNEKICEWVYSGLTKQIHHRDEVAPASVVIPSALVEIRKNPNAEDVG